MFELRKLPCFSALADLVGVFVAAPMLALFSLHNKFFDDYAILALSVGLAPSGGIYMQFVKGETTRNPKRTLPSSSYRI
jgi:hypothetical protein